MHTAFLELKDALMIAPILTIPDCDKQFIVEIDMSGVGIGVTLMQEGRPLAFYSHALLSSTIRKSADRIELYIVVMTVK